MVGTSAYVYVPTGTNLLYMGSLLMQIASIGLNLGVGFTLARLAKPSIRNWYSKLKKPSWIPPNAVFAPVWSALYTAMGVASWLVFKQGGFSAQSKPLGIYALHLALNFTWHALFFQAKRPDVAMVEILGLLVMTAATAQAFHEVTPIAGYLMAPAVAWVAFAAAINAGLLRSNPKLHKLRAGNRKGFPAAARAKVKL